MIKSLANGLIAFFAIIIGVYPVIYFLVDRKFGLLSSKTDELLANPIWNIAFYTHIIFGGIALLIGWTQFSKKLRNTNLTLHRTIGKIYVSCVLLSGTAGLYIAFFATAGIIASTGFIGLAVVWLSTTWLAYRNIKRRNIDQHEVMMIFSYAACFAAVTLRIWLPMLTAYFGDFDTGYRIVAWLCWVPNMVVAALIVRNKLLRRPQ